jgi:Ca-activated chloride channel family protein
LNVPEQNPEEKAGSDVPVTVTVTPLKQHILTGISNKVPVLLKIVTTEVPKQTQKKDRVPLNLAIVLDRSGSMYGPKLENAKKAVIKIIENLHPDDIVHFVCYGSKVVTIFENESYKNEQNITKLVTDVRTKGMTNISGGIETGSKLLDQHQQDGFSKRMFLFSDGRANKGTTSVEGITKIVGDIKNKSNIKVDSFGIGEDFDPTMMKNIAEFGSGSFFFIDSAEAIQTLVGKALDGLMELVGEDTVLKVRGSGPGIVKQIYGKDASTLISGANLGDLHENNTRTQLINLGVSPKYAGRFNVMTWNLSFTFNNKTICLEGTLHLTATNDSEEVAKSKEDADVQVAIAVEAAAESDEKIQKFIEAGQTKRALTEQNMQIQSLEACAKFDRSNMIGIFIHHAKDSKKLIQTEGCSKRNQQKMAHNAYTKRRGSTKYASNYVHGQKK